MIKNNSYTNKLIFFLSVIANTLSLHMLLDSDKLTESNFDSWYQKLKIILEHERILYVLTDRHLKNLQPMFFMLREKLI